MISCVTGLHPPNLHILQKNKQRQASPRPYIYAMHNLPVRRLVLCRDICTPVDALPLCIDSKLRSLRTQNSNVRKRLFPSAGALRVASLGIGIPKVVIFDPSARKDKLVVANMSKFLDWNKLLVENFLCFILKIPFVGETSRQNARFRNSQASYNGIWNIVT